MWLYVPSTTSPSAPASEALTSESISPCPKPAVWLTLNGKPTQRPLSWPGWKTRPWIARLSGTILQPSTADLGAEQWISRLRASRARETASPASASSGTIPATSGPLPGASFARLAADSSSWRTSSASLFPTELLDEKPLSEGSSESWPKTGGMRNGVCFQRKGSAPRISASGSSSWPTVRTCAGTRSSGANRTEFTRLWPTVRAKEDGAYQVSDGRQVETLTGAARGWPSPRAEDAESCGAHPNGGGDSLTAQAKLWSTPTAEDHKSDGPAALGRYGTDEELQTDRRLRTQAMLWPTPEAGDAKGHACHSRGPENPTLNGLATLWRTPTERDHHPTSQGERSCGLPPTLQLAHQATSWPTPNAHPTAPNGGLNRGGGRISGRSKSQCLDAVAQATTRSSPAARDYRAPNVDADQHPDQLANQAAHLSPSSRLDPETETPGPASSPSTRRLNPRFVEWLMGWPIGWTDCEQPATGSFHSWQQLHSSRLLDAWEVLK